MKPLEKVKTFETPLGTSWFDEDGILHSNLKSIPLTLENMKYSFDVLRQITNNKKVCILADATYARPIEKKVREFASEEISKFLKAIAIISSSPVGTMIANIFLTLKGQPVPTKIFTDEKDAREWLKQYL